MISSAKRVPVLVVESIDNMRTTLVSMLTNIGFTQIRQAKGVNDALDYLSGRPVGLIIADLNLPGAGGLGFLREVRKSEALCEIPFLLISSEISKAQLTEAVKLGVSQFVLKPFSQKILESRIIKSLNHTGKWKLEVEEQDQEQESLEVEDKRLSVLVVDDVVENIHIVVNILKHDYKVLAAKSGRQAIEICRSNNAPDLVLLDIMMPEVNGIEVMRFLAKSELTQQIKVIFLTSISENDKVVKGLEMGAVDFISKPISAEVLKARVKTHASIIRSQQAAYEQIDTMIENNRLRDEFESSLRYTLKKQLDVTRNSIDQIRKSKKNTQYIDNLLVSIENSALMMTQLIDNMMSIYKIKNGQYSLSMQAVNLVDELKAVLAMNEAVVKSKHLEVNLSNQASEEMVYADEVLIKSICMNVLQYSIASAPKGAAIHIDTSMVNHHFKLCITYAGQLSQAMLQALKPNAHFATTDPLLAIYAASLMMGAMEQAIQLRSVNGKEIVIELTLPRP
ncbi:response regulator [Motilimonas sp. KMU-193]|uniref:hybrid sensor histidine kinase/response regulator n=1 Tax=Motilimonas sp. KMU-193 TaxID=3388668 RepID=UPI00396B249A